MQCPSGCLCKGNIISCRSISEIDKNLVISPLVLLLDDSNGMFETMLNNPSQLESTLYLKMHHGDFQKHLLQEQSALTYCKSLRLLQLSNQGIEKLRREFIYGSLVMLLNLSHNIIYAIEHQAFSNLKNVQILILDFNRLSVLRMDFGTNLKLLKFLYLQQNPLQDIAAQIVFNFPDVSFVRSDWYMMCCVLHDVENCEPKGHLVSSCKSLLSFITIKVFIALQAIVATIVNGAIILRFLTIKQNNPDFPLTFSFAIADFMMGVYLMILAITDVYTNGRFYQYI